MRFASFSFGACLMGFMATMAYAGDDVIWVGKFSVQSDENTQTTAIPSPWQPIQLDKRVAATRYQMRLWDGVAAVEAIADKSMTLLARPVDVNLVRTPILCWRWRIDAPLVQADMASKRGDDYAARVYVAFKLPPSMLGFATRAKLALARKIYGDSVPDAAINYVWDNRYAIGTQRPNAFTSRTQMIVQESGSSKSNTWVSERRDLMADFKSAFDPTNTNADHAQVTLIALAADTDNTGERAHAGFADIHLVPRDQECKVY